MEPTKVMLKYTIPSFVSYLWPSLTWKVNTSDKVVYLTFDDGPHPEITTYVLDILKEFNALATFFCVGDNVVKYPHIMSKILLDGHQIGNHTQHHLSGWKTQNQSYFEDISEAATHINSNLFRPPYGQITPKQANFLKQRYNIIMWSLLTCDYDKKLPVQKALSFIKQQTKKGDIIVFHDSEKAYHNLKQLLPDYLAHLTKEGFKFATL